MTPIKEALAALYFKFAILASRLSTAIDAHSRFNLSRGHTQDLVDPKSVMNNLPVDEALRLSTGGPVHCEHLKV